MGNRAVIVSHDTTKENAHRKIGLYVHWNGCPGNVAEVLQQAQKAGVRNVDYDEQYFWARFCQCYANYISDGKVEETSIGIGIVNCLDCNNGDNGVYYIDGNFKVVKQTDGKELV